MLAHLGIVLFELSIIIAVGAPLLLVASLSMTAQAADATLMLACQGTVTTPTMPETKPESVSMGIIVNFTARTVQGFGSPGLMDYPVKITGANDVTVVFRGSGTFGISEMSLNGSIDRITGDVEATSMLTNAQTGKIISSTFYLLKCRPTQRMF